MIARLIFRSKLWDSQDAKSLLFTNQIHFHIILVKFSRSKQIQPGKNCLVDEAHAHRYWILMRGDQNKYQSCFTEACMARKREWMRVYTTRRQKCTISTRSIISRSPDEESSFFSTHIRDLILSDPAKVNRKPVANPRLVWQITSNLWYLPIRREASLAQKM